jgi:hypothetical protein
MKIAEKYLTNISVASVCLLLLIWVLPDTIALRNILLVLGGLCGLALIKENWNYFNSFSPRMLPLYLVLSLFIWVLIHYSFFSLNRQLEFSEIKSLWLRAFAGLLMAIGLALSLHKNADLRKYFFFSLFFVPIINLAAYGYVSYLNGGLVKPNDFVRFLFIKIETTYFGAIASAFAIANLIYFLVFKKSENNLYRALPYLAGLVLVLVSALILGTKNGIAIAVALCLFFGLILMIDVLSNIRKASIVSIFACVLVLVATGFVWKGHKASAYEGWDTIFSDARIAVQIDNYKNWQEGEHEFVRPTNDMGSLVVGNTYFRLAWVTVGARLISNYPLGYGSINRSFVGLLDEAKIEHVHQGQVHSGWIDFGLAYGIPGLLLLFSAMLLIIGFATMNPTLLSLCAGMICIALIPMGVIAEICYKQYFEATIFFITLASTLIILEGKSTTHAIKYD